MAVVDVDVTDHVAIITLNRPEVHNAMNPEVHVRLGDAWLRVSEDNDIRAAIVTGAGEKAFCAGADLRELVPLLTKARGPQDEWDRKIVAGEARPMLDPGKPVIAAVNGYAVAGGMELVQATDLRVAADHARFGLQEVRRALFPGGASTVRLPRQIPPAIAMELLLTGDMVDAARAYQLGFVNRVVPLGRLMDEAMALAATIARNGPLAVRAIRESAKACLGLPESQGLEIERKFAAKVFASKDAIEGPKAFLEKREPQYQGL